MSAGKPRCGKWMPRAREYCGDTAGHGGRCRTARAAQDQAARAVKRRARVVAENQRRVDEYKMEQGCIDCGYAEHPVALDFDHDDRSLKVAKISQITWKPWEEIFAEIRKCSVRCANCHRIKTAYRRDYGRRRPASS